MSACLHIRSVYRGIVVYTDPPTPPPSKLLFSGANRRWIPLFNCTNLSPTFLQLAPIFRSVFCWIQSSSHQRSGFPCSAFQIFDNRHACYSLTEDHKTNNNKITAKSTENPHNIPPTQWIKQGGLWVIIRKSPAYPFLPRLWGQGRGDADSGSLPHSVSLARWTLSMHQ